jgi:hypothetical protein
VFCFSYSEIIAPTENSTDSSQTRNSLISSTTNTDLQLKESSEECKTTNNYEDTKLHAVRCHKTETDWDELLTQVSSSPMKEKDKCSSFFTMMVVRVPPSLFLSFFSSFTVPETRYIYKTEKKR